ncbi:hypothetical protein [Marinivivus vitaminiproducens]|uniref:hypothetical protein n=1 Tax=Marinivivus vitaminiproducens TaxID=3035935 RepID=UPI0027A032B8|nr:hypothetical protein P4R82_23585 [Geminicoccaceae bacterium SCSIO 64248]WGF90917.1 hypothetical protein P4R82_24240 [Geminicoccaceae bacterium SCSIO 64248]
MPYAPYHSALVIGLILIGAGTVGVEHYRAGPAEMEALPIAWAALLLGFLFAIGSSTGKLIAAGPGSLLLLGLWAGTIGVGYLAFTTDLETLTTPFWVGPLSMAVLATLTHLRSFD